MDAGQPPAWAVAASDPRQQQQQQVTTGGYPPVVGGQQNQQAVPPQQQQQHVPQQQQGYVPQASPSVGTPQRTPQVVSPPATPPTAPAPAAPSPPRKTQQLTQQQRLDQRMLVTRTADEETEDGRIRNLEAVKMIRDAWIYKQVRARQDEFTQYKDALLYVGTWNVNAKGKEEPLDEWLCADWGPNGEHAPDIAVIGFQEIVDLNAVNVAVDNKTQQRSQFWVERLRATLNSPKNTRNDQSRHYTLMMQRYMVGLLICVFVKTRHTNKVRYVHSDSVGVGVMGMMGNKGGVSIRLQFYDSTICFVCSHLAAHRENVAGRNADFANVLTKTSFDVGEEAIRESIRSGALSHWASGSSSVGVLEHDLVVWLGDLNYRVDESISTEAVLQLSEKGQLDELNRNDQLNIERARGRAFEGFEEGHLSFPPTYKYQPGTDVYEQRPDKKLRAPAWCDRILWSAQNPSHIQQLTYRRSETPNCSDHKPVYSTLKLTVKEVIPQKRDAIYVELMKLIDRFENQTLPIVGLDRISLDFGEIRYGQSVTLPIQVTNTGNVVAHFRFVPKLDENALCKPWLRLSPTYGMLIPGEQPMTVNFTATIDNKTAQLINSGREVLDDILILRLENGRDYYITVKASYARSCFAMTLDELVMYSEPIRNVPLDPVKRSERFDPNASAALCVPKELWRMVDAIYEKGLQTPDVFSFPGNEDEINQIRECLDTGTHFGVYSIHSFVGALTAFLSSLATPILPDTVFPTLEIDSQNIQSSARRLLGSLPPIHYNVFVYLISFYREALHYREQNKLTAAKLARVCCNCMMQGGANGGDSSSAQRKAGMQLILLHLMETNSI